MNLQRGKLVSGGRLQVPADIRRALDIGDGDIVTMRVVDGELHIRPARVSIEKVRARLHPYLSGSSSMADELIAERHAESERE